jgi:hypothetical protein
MSDPDLNPSGEDDVERQREADPDAPGLGVVDGEDEDPPEPNEPA